MDTHQPGTLDLKTNTKLRKSEMHSVNNYLLGAHQTSISVLGTENKAMQVGSIRAPVALMFQWEPEAINY